MSRFNHWLTAARPRTLFLAVATVIVGSGLAAYQQKFSTITFVLTFLLAVAIQILANFANDLGDYDKGTDTTGQRKGPERSLQSGAITRPQMKRAIVLTTILTALIGLAVIVLRLQWTTQTLWMIAVGILSILAALFYTMGKFAYGYYGMGDLFAFLFFGPVPVIGTYYLHTQSLSWFAVLPAIGLGVVSTLILNVNNMRDIDNDKASGKNTIAVRLGLRQAKAYHMVLVLVWIASFVAFSLVYTPAPLWRFAYLIGFVFALRVVWRILHAEGKALDPYLKQTALSGFVLSVLFVICLLV